MSSGVELQFQASEGAVAPLTSYSSYRAYLRDLLAAEKRENSAATFVRVGKAFGMSGPALQMIVSGTRNLSIHSVYRIARVLKFTPQEIEYFEALVLHEQAKSEDERAYHESKLNRIRSGVEPAHVRVPSAVMFSRWFVPALLVYLTEVHEQRGGEGVDCEAIARQFGVPAEDIASILDKLRAAGILSLSPQGRKFHFQPDKLVNSFSQKRFMASLLAEAQKRVETEFTSPTSFFSADTFAIPASTIRSFVLDYKALVQRYMALAPTQEKGVAIMQCAIELFPVWMQDS